MTQFIQLQLPINVGVTIEEDAPVFLVKQFIESLNHPFLNTNRVRRWRKSKLTNRQLLAMIYSYYYEGIYSSRKIANRIKRDTHSMYLTDGLHVSHTTINNFRLKLKDGLLEELFILFVKKLSELDEIRFDTIYILNI